MLTEIFSSLLRRRLSDAIEAQVEDIRQWNIQYRTEEAERQLLRTLQDTVSEIIQRTR